MNITLQLTFPFMDVLIIFFCLLFCSAYNDASNRSAHEKKKHGGLFQAGACTEIKEDCES